jgi:phosphoribosylanthranilate isomerase
MASAPAQRLTIKICGLSTAAAVDAVAQNGGDMAGFIFFPKSPRNVTVEAAAGLAEHAASLKLQTVAVTVDADDAMLDAIIAGMRPHWLQLHGHETPARVAELKARHGLPVMKALPLSGQADLAGVTPFLGLADRFLFDAKPPKDAVLPGGNAVSFDWRILHGLPAGLDFLLAGGLDAGNVGDAIAIAKPPGLDISSGVEGAPGVKDVTKIAAFLKAARG